jgi:DinB superfamily
MSEDVDRAASYTSDAVVSDLLVRTIVALYQRVHQELRDELQDVDGQALAWSPGPDTNSISTLVAHLLASEAEMLRSVRGLPSARDRRVEFAAPPTTRDELLRRLDAADADLDHLGGGIRVQDLQALRVRPNKPTPQSGLFWLLRNYGHAREHLAHLQLTKQVYRFAHPVGR